MDLQYGAVEHVFTTCTQTGFSSSKEILPPRIFFSVLCVCAHKPPPNKPPLPPPTYARSCHIHFAACFCSVPTKRLFRIARQGACPPRTRLYLPGHWACWDCVRTKSSAFSRARGLPRYRRPPRTTCLTLRGAWRGRELSVGELRWSVSNLGYDRLGMSAVSRRLFMLFAGSWWRFLPKLREISFGRESVY